MIARKLRNEQQNNSRTDFVTIPSRSRAKDQQSEPLLWDAGKAYTMARLLLFLLTFLASEIAIAQPSHTNHSYKNVVLIGWDGTDRKFVMSLLEAKQLPVLASIVNTGSFVKIQVRGTTDSVAGWTEILTGCTPDITKVVSGEEYLPVDPKLTVFTRIKKPYQERGLDIFCAAILAKGGSFGATNPTTLQLFDPTHPPSTNALRRIVTIDGTNYLQLVGGVAADLWHTVDEWHSRAGNNSNAAYIATSLIRTLTNQPFFIFVHFADADNAGHQFGSDSPNYIAAIKRNDFYTGIILDTIKNVGLMDQTLIFVVSDHGFDPNAKTHLAAPDSFLVANIRGLQESGTRADVLPTILEALGILHQCTNPPMSGVSLLKRTELTGTR